MFGGNIPGPFDQTRAPGGGGARRGGLLFGLPATRVIPRRLGQRCQSASQRTAAPVLPGPFSFSSGADYRADLDGH